MNPADPPKPLAPERPAVSRLASALRTAVERAADGAVAVSVLFSGGLDSGLVAFLLPHSIPAELVTVGLPGSGDLESGTASARLLGRPSRAVLLSEAEVLRMSNRLREMGVSERSRSVQVALALGVGAASHRRVIAAQGADELFFGYSHFRGQPGKELQRIQRSDLERLDSQDWPRARAIASELGHDLHSPFVDASVRSIGLSLALPHLSEGREMKPALREAARFLGLPEEIAGRPKRAIQFGTGIDKLLRHAPP
jgi:asparagine synthase (glutamine-hydrolysing)